MIYDLWIGAFHNVLDIASMKWEPFEIQIYECVNRKEIS